MKKKFIVSFAILFYLLLLVFSGCTFANWSAGEFELYGSQVFSNIENGLVDYSTWFSNFLNSSAYYNKKSDIPFNQFDNLIIRRGSNDTLIIFLFNSDSSISVDSNGLMQPLADITDGWFIRFTCDRRNWSYSYDITLDPYYWQTNNDGFQVLPTVNNFSLIFTNNSIINQYNKIIYGLNYTANTPVYNGSSTVDIGEYYKLSTGFIGSYYYDNLNNLNYVILDNQSNEYVGLKNIQYSTVSNGQKVEIYIYVEQSMNQKGYKVLLYYNNEILYQENAYNTLLINGGSSSGDNGNFGSVDLSETNNLITGVINTIISGDDSIINTIKSGDSNIINAIRSGDAYIVSSILDDSETDSLLEDLYSSGDDIYDLVNELGFKRFENPYQNLIFGLIEDLCDSLTSSGDAYIKINLHNGRTKKIYASEFYVSDPTIRTFVSGFLIFGILFVLFNYLRKSIDNISAGDVKQVIKNIEVDTNFIKM